jgi:hypothetical protein
MAFTSQQVAKMATKLGGTGASTGHYLSDWRTAFLGGRGQVTDEISKLSALGASASDTKLSDKWVNYMDTVETKSSGRYTQDKQRFYESEAF